MGKRDKGTPAATTLPAETDAPKPPSSGEVTPLDGVQGEIGDAERSLDEHVDTGTGEVTDERSTLEILQDGVRSLFDYDQLQEIRLALSDRREALEKHRKKGTELGVFEEDAGRRLRVIDGTEIRFGLLRVFAPEQVTEQRDVFFNRDAPDGRPEPTEPEEPEDPDAAPLAAETGVPTDGEPVAVGAPA